MWDSSTYCFTQIHSLARLSSHSTNQPIRHGFPHGCWGGLSQRLLRLYPTRVLSHTPGCEALAQISPQWKTAGEGQGLLSGIHECKRVSSPACCLWRRQKGRRGDLCPPHSRQEARLALSCSHPWDWLTHNPNSRVGSECCSRRRAGIALLI